MPQLARSEATLASKNLQPTPTNWLKTFQDHGVNIDSKKATDTHAVGQCPFCDRDGKFYIEQKSGLWQCKTCDQSGNALTFLRQFYDYCIEQDGAGMLLQDNRKLLYQQTIDEWGIRKNPLNDEWVVPAYSADGKLCQLYRYVQGGNRSLLLPTTNMGHYLFGVNLYDDSKPEVWLGESVWDVMACFEVLRQSRWVESSDGENKLKITGNADVSLLSNVNLLATPGCNVFNPAWCRLFEGKRVTLLTQNDHCKVHPKTQKLIEGASYHGMKRMAQILAAAEQPPEVIRWVRWGTCIDPEGTEDPESGYFNSDLKHGYDARDLLSSGGKSILQRVQKLSELIQKVEPMPADWVDGRSKSAIKAGDPEMQCLHCNSYKKLTNAWRVAMHWYDGLDKALSVMLACITSTEAVGDQLWVKIISPPSSGKSVLCEGLSLNKRYTFAKSTLRGFHSGYDDGTDKNYSPLESMKNKTLITKDGDALLQAPNLGQILSEARDVYDRVSRSSYRTTKSKDWEGLNITWLLCGTSSLRALDSSELGERFLDCVIVDQMPEELEDDIGWRVALRADRELSYVADGKVETRDAPEMVKAKQLTGGYVSYLRENAASLLPLVKIPHHHLKRCQQIAKFVAFMRARPSKTQDEEAQREMSFRLITQHVRLAKCLAVVLNKKEVDEQVINRVVQVGLDTARGRTFKIVESLYRHNDTGLSMQSISNITKDTKKKLDELVLFLDKIGVIEPMHKGLSPYRAHARWRLTDRLYKLYKEAVQPEEDDPVDPEE